MNEFKKIISNLRLENVKAYLEKYGPIVDKKIAIEAIIINPVAYAIMDEKLQKDEEVVIYWYPSLVNIEKIKSISPDEASILKMPYWSNVIIEPFNAFIKSICINNYDSVINVQTIFNGELENNPFRLDYQRILTELVRKSKIEKRTKDVFYSRNKFTTYVIDRNLILDLVNQMHKSDDKTKVL